MKKIKKIKQIKEVRIFNFMGQEVVIKIMPGSEAYKLSKKKILEIANRTIRLILS